MFAVYLLKSEAAGEMANSALLLLINDAGLTFLLCSRCVMGENKVPSLARFVGEESGLDAREMEAHAKRG